MISSMSGSSAPQANRRKPDDTIMARLSMPADEPVRSRANPLFKRLRALKERGPEGALCLLEGPKLVLEALGAGARRRGGGLLAPRAADDARGRRGARRARRPDGPAALAERRAAGLALRGRDVAGPAWPSRAGRRSTRRSSTGRRRSWWWPTPSRTPATSAACCARPRRPARRARTSPAGSADPLSWKALRGSMGSAFRLPHVRGLDADTALDRAAGAWPRRARDRGRRRAALRRGRPARPGRRSWSAARARGSPRAVRQRAAARLRIPLAPPVESLNVGVAVALVLYEAARQRGFARAVTPRRLRA